MEVLTLLEEYIAARDAAAVEWGGALWSLTKARRSVASRSPALTVATPLEASSLLRYELEPQTVVTVDSSNNSNTITKDEPEPDLTCEENSGGDEKKAETMTNATSKSTTEPTHPRYVMVNVADERAKHKENEAQPSAVSWTNTNNSNSNATGLRQRKGATQKSSTSSSSGIDTANAATNNASNKSVVASNRTHHNAATTTTMTVEDAPTLHGETNNNCDNYNNDPVLLLAGMLPPRELRVAQQQATAALEMYIRVANLTVELQNKMRVQQ